VQTVTNLDEDDTDIIAHRQQQFLEILRLGRGLLTEDTATDLGQSVDNLCNLSPEDVFYVLNGVVGIFNNVME
jgi:hypothetical protein